MRVAPTPTWALATLLAMSACGGNETASSTGSERGTSCPSGHVEHPSGEGCIPVGIQGCADMFLEEDGLCYPALDKCPAGTIPQFSEGCRCGARRSTSKPPSCALRFHATMATSGEA